MIRLTEVNTTADAASNVAAIAYSTADAASNAASILMKDPVAFSNVAVSGDILPTQTQSQSIGSSNFRFSQAWIDELHISTNTLYLGDTPILGTDQDTVLVKADPNHSINILTTGTGTTSMTSTAGVNMNVSGLNASIVAQATGSGGRAIFGADTEITFTAPLSSFNGNTTTAGSVYCGGAMTVNGSLVVNGSNFITNAETVQISDNIILVNAGQVGNGVSAGQAGLRVDRGDSPDYLLVFDEAAQMFQAGAIGALETLTTQPYAAQVATNYLAKNSNLSDISSASVARTNLGIGTNDNVTFSSVTANGSGLTNLNASAIATGTLNAARIADKSLSGDKLQASPTVTGVLTINKESAGPFPDNLVLTNTLNANRNTWSIGPYSFGAGDLAFASTSYGSNASNSVVRFSSDGDVSAKTLRAREGIVSERNAYVGLSDTSQMNSTFAIRNSSNLGINSTIEAYPLMLGNNLAGNVSTGIGFYNATGVNSNHTPGAAIHYNRIGSSDFRGDMNVMVQTIGGLSNPLTTVMRLDSSGNMTTTGNFGIGTNTPAATLDVRGSMLGTLALGGPFTKPPLLVSSLNSTTSNDRYFHVRGDYTVFARTHAENTNSTDAFQVYGRKSQTTPLLLVRGTGNTEIDGNLTVAGTVTATSFPTSSDDRIKSDEAFIADATSTLNKLRPQTYTKWSSIDYASDSNSTSHRESGLIAQEMFYDSPELRHLVTPGAGADSNFLYSSNVTSSSDPAVDPDYSAWGSNVASVNYVGLIPYLVKALQEKDAQIREAQSNIAYLMTSKEGAGAA